MQFMSSKISTSYCLESSDTNYVWDGFLPNTMKWEDTVRRPIEGGFMVNREEVAEDVRNVNKCYF